MYSPHSPLLVTLIVHESTHFCLSLTWHGSSAQTGDMNVGDLVESALPMTRFSMCRSSFRLHGVEYGHRRPQVIERALNEWTTS